MPELQQFLSGRLRLVGAQFVEKSETGGNRTGFLIVQAGKRYEQAAHAVPQVLFVNLTNALKLRANQQEDGEGLLQNIVQDLGRESRRGLTDGLREFIEVDNNRDLDVGALRRGTGTFLKFGNRELWRRAQM